MKLEKELIEYLEAMAEAGEDCSKAYERSLFKGKFDLNLGKKSLQAAIDLAYQQGFHAGAAFGIRSAVNEINKRSK